MAQPATTPTEPDAGVRVGELFEAHGRMIYALCRLILRDGVEAEDAAQQTFLSAYRSLLNGRGPEQPEAWLATIARNECHNRIARRTPTAVELLETDGEGAPDPARLVDIRAEIQALCAAVAELPTKQREAIVLREFYGLSYREVAAALGTTGTAVESAIFKSRRSLQARLRPVRDAAGSLALPLSLQDSLSQLIPGFSQAAAGGGGMALVAKLSVPFGVKALVAGASVVAVGGTLAVGQAPQRHGATMRVTAPLSALGAQGAEAAPPVARASRAQVARPRTHTTSRARPVHNTVVVSRTVVVPRRAKPKHDNQSEKESSGGRASVAAAQTPESDTSNSGDVAAGSVASRFDHSENGRGGGGENGSHGQNGGNGQNVGHGGNGSGGNRGGGNVHVQSGHGDGGAPSEQSVAAVRDARGAAHDSTD
jgi:RNA polymerase sigma-70 factor (ECF subfamily)